MKGFSFIKEGGWLTMTIAVVVGVFAVVGLVQAASTISTNISTGGTLSVTGQSTLTTASSTAFSASGNFYVGGNATTTASTGTFSTAGSVVVVGTASTTNLLVGGGGTTVTGLLFGTCSITPGAIIASASTTVSCTATSVATGDKVFVTPPSSNESWLVVVGATSTTNAITIEIQNASSTATVTGLAHVWSWMAIR